MLHRLGLSLIPACGSQDGSGEPGLRLCRSLTFPSRAVSAPGLPTHPNTRRVKEKPRLVVSHLLRAKVGRFRGTAGDAEEGRERAATLFKDIATFIANQTNCPTVVTPCLRQRLASRIDVKHLKWEITN